MSLREPFALLCLVTGCFLADAFYLKLSPRNKALAIQTIKSEAGQQRYPDQLGHVTQWLRTNRRKPVTLDRTDGRVERLVQRLLTLIDKSQQSIKPKKHCKSFGNIYDVMNKRVVCARDGKAQKIDQVIPAVNPQGLGKGEIRRNAYVRGSSDSSIEGRMTRFEIIEDEGNARLRDKTRFVIGTDTEGHREELWNDIDGSSGDGSDKASVTESEEYIQRPYKKKGKKVSDGYAYMQGNRVIDANRRFHRDPKHFMAKRFHWNSGELSQLGYYWFEGAQGKDPRIQ